MLFSSIPFLFYFLPVVILVYFIVPHCFKNTILLCSSLFFYGWGEPKFLIFMIMSIAQGYIFGILIEKYHGKKRSKLFLTASVVFSLGLLVYCKYADFFIQNFNHITGLSIPLLKIVLPIGISFYTFQILSYAVDVYRQKVSAQKNLINLATYIAMFPQLIAGPIVRYSDIEPQLTNRTYSLQKFASGTRRFVIGLSKKILLANILGEFVTAFKGSEEKSVLFFWVYAIAYMLQIYFDFSGYSDMAIGLGRIFGFTFMENFRYPYISSSITEFWRRWHISLGTWFRDYLYIPLGGNRVSKSRWIFNLFLVWMATGLWHGAAWNFILWGLLFAFFLIMEKLWLLPFLQKIKGLCHVYVLFLVLISFVLFDAADLSSAVFYFRSMFGATGISFISVDTLYAIKSYAIIFLISILGATPLPNMMVQKLSIKKGTAVLMDIVQPIVTVGLLALCTAYLVDGSFNPFLYFRF
jgi:alginate O-acetyltransferase complex protein AlgI